MIYKSQKKRFNKYVEHSSSQADGCSTGQEIARFFVEPTSLPYSQVPTAGPCTRINLLKPSGNFTYHQV
jgi:hypothetical protein